MREADWSKVLGWPGYRVYRHEIDEPAKRLKLWVRRKRGNRKLICSGCGRKLAEAYDSYEREVRDLPCFEFRTTVVVEVYRVCCPDCGIKIEKVLSTLTPEEQEREYGAALWSRDPDKCCGLRKVEPLRAKLTELRAWVTAIRRDQTSARASARKVEWDAKFQLLKINPLADWTSPMVWSYALKHNVPYNPLHDKNYPSIGCTHCTRAVRPGESSRAGRWSGFDKVECGLHVAAPTAIAPLVEIKVKSSFGCEES